MNQDTDIDKVLCVGKSCMLNITKSFTKKEFFLETDFLRRLRSIRSTPTPTFETR